MSTLTNIQILRSAVPYKRPDPAFLLDGQLGINYKAEEPGLFTKLQDGGTVKFGPVAITTTGFAPNSSPAADGFPGNSVGEEWLDSRAAFYRPIEHIYDGTNWLVTNGFKVDYNTGDFTLLKKLTISALEADVAHIDGPLMVNGDITPDGTTCAHDLGNGSERWAGIYACAGDISGDLSLGGNLTLGQDLNIGGSLSVNEDITVNGNAVFGMACGSGDKFTVKSPTYLDCLVEILGHTQGTDMTLSGNLVVEGDVTVGQGCSTTLLVKSKTIFQCDVEFNTNPVVFEYLTVTDLLDSQGDTILGKDCGDKITINGTTTFANCITTMEGETRIGLTSGAALRTFGPNVFNEDISGNSDLLIMQGKGYSKLTVDSDPNYTLVTKGWVESGIAGIRYPWQERGLALLPTEENISILPNLGGDIGDTGVRWGTFYGETLSLTAKGTSAETVNSDPDDTLITKKWAEDMAELKASLANYWDLDSTDLSPKIINSSVYPNGTGNLGLPTERWNNIYGGGLSLTSKGTSALTVNSDPSNTLITKGWAETLVINSISDIDFWQKSGVNISPNTQNDNVTPYGNACDLGIAGNVWRTVNSKNLVLTAKGTSAVTINSDPDNTLTTKKWVEDTITSSIPSPLWNSVGVTLVPTTTNKDIHPNGDGDLGSASTRWQGIFAKDLSLTGKGTSAVTVSGDPDNTLTTKKWVEDMIGGSATTPNWTSLSAGLAPAIPNEDVIPNGTGKLGLTSNKWSEVNAVKLTLSDKATSAATVNSDSNTTLTTKKWVEDTIATAVPWNTVGSTIVPKVANRTIVPNGTANLGQNSNRWNVVNAVSLSLSAKGTSAATVNSDPDNTLTTKKWVEDALAGASSTQLWSSVGATLTSLTSNKSVVPNGTSDLGQSSNKWNKVWATDVDASSVHADNVYTGDLHMKNERGDWTLIEEEDCLTMTNNKTGKRYAISMTPYTG